ncbi:MAG TPA: hypothetical protein P5081_18145 [Phycisphaerae bacterium]|nr:hypothetical protein [Phycisphaerae bacterium]HRW54793.1 hypothetical protein [Phycisphaerae bacterium]
MDTPKPTPKPATGISLHPPRPAGAPAPRPAGAAAPRPVGPGVPGQRPPAPRPAAQRPAGPQTVKVVHDRNAKPAPKDTPRPGGFRLTIGFVLAVIGGLAIAYYPEPFSAIVKAGVTKYYEYEAIGVNAFSPDAVPSVVAAAAIEKANQLAQSYSHLYRWTPQVAGALCILLAGWCLKKRVGLFIAASLAVAITIGALAAAYDWFIPPHCLTLPGFALGYLIEAGARPTNITIRGLIGFAFVLASIVGLALGVFYLPRWGAESATISDSIAKHGPQYLWGEPAGATSVYFLSEAFVKQWTDVALWGAALLTASIGAVLCRDKLLRFLSACLIVTLTILLFKSAYVKWIAFPMLGPDVPAQPKWSYTNIEIWQWVALVELVIVAAVLIYKSIGAGGLTVAVALVWLCCCMQVDTFAWRINTARVLSSASAQQISKPQILPTDPAPGAEPQHHAGMLGADVRMTEAEMKSVAAGLGAPLGWFYLTMILSGVMIAAGLRMMITCKSARTLVMCMLWVGFCALAALVVWRWPTSEAFDPAKLMAAISTHAVHRTLALCLSAGAAALFGTWALRWDSRYHTWLYTAATSVFISTLLSFIALAVMIRWGGFGKLPVASYIILAVGQSALMWVLLLHANFVQPEPATVTAGAPQRRAA